MLKKNGLIKTSYENITPYVPGLPAELLAKKLGLSHVIKLASNECPLGASPLAQKAAVDAIRNAHLYPDSDATYLRDKLSERLEFNKNRIIIGSGADSIIHALCQTFVSPGNEVIASQYAFASYEIATKANEGVFKAAKAHDYAHDLPNMLELINEKTRLIFLANPNNPTGTFFNHTAFLDFLQQVPKQVFVILDQAYLEFLEKHDEFDYLSLLQAHENLIILRTFSKAYGLAGFRVGYGIAHPEIIELLNRIRSPFTISVPALAAASAALDDVDFLQQVIHDNATNKACFSKKLTNLGLNSISNYGNFLTVNFGDKTTDIFENLLKKGIILRPLNNYQMLEHLRISIGTTEEMNLLINELESL